MKKLLLILILTLSFQTLIKADDIKDFQPQKVNKKKTVYVRHQGMTKNNSPTIKTKGLRIKELFKLNSDEFK